MVLSMGVQTAGWVSVFQFSRALNLRDEGQAVLLTHACRPRQDISVLPNADVRGHFLQRYLARDKPGETRPPEKKVGLSF